MALGLAAMARCQVEIVLPEHSNHTMTMGPAGAAAGAVRAGGPCWLRPSPFRSIPSDDVDDIWSLIGSGNLGT